MTSPVQSYLSSAMWFDNVTRSGWPWQSRGTEGQCGRDTAARPRAAQRRMVDRARIGAVGSGRRERRGLPLSLGSLVPTLPSDGWRGGITAFRAAIPVGRISTGEPPGSYPADADFRATPAR
jgi:hypothetical protein